MKSGRKELRRFGITMGVVGGLVGLGLWWRGKEWYMYLIGVAVVFLLIGVMLPALLRPAYRVWMGFSLILGWVMTVVILLLLFYCAITPLALMARVVGKDFLNRKGNKKVNSYWIPKERDATSRERYKNQF